MGKLHEKAAEYHEQFAARIIKALEAGTAPWQKPWKPGERILPHNFQSGRDYRGGNALYLALNALERGFADPRWGGYRQIQEAGGHVRKGEKGTPIMYVDFRQRRTARDEAGNPVRDEEGRPKLEWVQRDRPLVKLHHVFNVEQTEGLQLRSLATAGPEWEGHERAEALIQASGVRVDHVAGDRAYYSLKADRVVLPERSQFPSQDAYTHTALHELGHATGHPDRLNRPTLVNHGGFGTDTYAREELRAEIAAMMTGEQLGVGHEPRHGTAYVSSWIKALENDPKEIRAAAVDAQRISDWLLARERERSVADEKAEHDRPEGAGGRPPEREPERPPQPAPQVGGAAQAEHDSAMRVPGRPIQVVDPAAATGRDGPAMSEDLKTVLRDMGAAGYRTGYQAALDRQAIDPHQSARVHFPAGAGREIRFVLEQVHADAFLRGMHDQQRRFDPAPDAGGAAGLQQRAIRQVEAELKTVLREIGAAGYDRGYDDGEAGRKRPPRPDRGGPSDRGPGDAAEYLREDVAARAYARGRDDHFRGASREDAAGRRLQVDYVKEVTSIGENDLAKLRYTPRRARAGGQERSPRAVPAAADAPQAGRDPVLGELARSRQAIERAAAGARQRDSGPSR